MKKFYVSLPFWILIVISLVTAYRGEYLISGGAAVFLMVFGWLMLKTKKIDNFKIDLDDKSLSVNQKEHDESN